MSYRSFCFACLLAAIAGGCASPGPRFYTLSGTTAEAASPSNLSVMVGPVSVPALVDRPQMVVTKSAGQVQFDEFNRWAMPLSDNISRVLLADLAQELGTTQVWAHSPPMPATPDVQVVVNVQRFDTTPGDAAVIDVMWTVRRSAGGSTKVGHSLVREPITAPGVESTIAAHSRALARVSADIATAIRAP
jgi:uncharacterized lipoprotein YmbA